MTKPMSDERFDEINRLWEEMFDGRRGVDAKWLGEFAEEAVAEIRRLRRIYAACKNDRDHMYHKCDTYHERIVRLEDQLRDVYEPDDSKQDGLP